MFAFACTNRWKLHSVHPTHAHDRACTHRGIIIYRYKFTCIHVKDLDQDSFRWLPWSSVLYMDMDPVRNVCMCACVVYVCMRCVCVCMYVCCVCVCVCVCVRERERERVLVCARVCMSALVRACAC